MSDGARKRQGSGTEENFAGARAHLFWQVSVGQMAGSVNLNCCSTLRMTVPHSRHRKQPIKSSGRTSLVRVTVPAQ